MMMDSMHTWNGGKLAGFDKAASRRFAPASGER